MSQKLKILIANPSQKNKGFFPVYFKDEPDMELVGFVTDDMQEFFRLAQEREPDVIVLDASFPRHPSGMVIMRDLREQGINTPCIVTSNTQANYDEAMASGAKQFLLKPLSLERLMNTLRNMFVSRKLKLLIAEPNYSLRMLYPLSISGTPDIELVGIVAVGVQEFFCLVQEKKPDVIVLDGDFPRRWVGSATYPRGITAMHDLREQGVNTPCIMTSCTYRDHDEAVSIGATRFMMKPFGVDQLLRAIRSIENST